MTYRKCLKKNINNFLIIYEDAVRRAKKYMKKKINKFDSNEIKYSNEPINAKVIKDFLPKPEDLVFKEEKVKVTLSLSKRSVEFFKQEAAKYNTAYQTMIRRLLDYCATQ